LIFEVRVDSIPGVSGAQVSLRNKSVTRDIPYASSLTTTVVPAGRYYLRARRIAAEMLQDSMDVRSGFADTVKIVLGRDIVCLE
jgi:hypothetical protein